MPKLLEQVAADFGISESCLTGGLKGAEFEDEIKPDPPVRRRSRTGNCASVSGCSSGRTKSYAEQPPISLRRACRENNVPARSWAGRGRHCRHGDAPRESRTASQVRSRPRCPSITKREERSTSVAIDDPPSAPM
jgi:hypothetical protein